jgi:hypothetical protein
LTNVDGVQMRRAPGYFDRFSDGAGRGLDPIAEIERLFDVERDAGDDVGDGFLYREADDRRQHAGGRQHAAERLVEDERHDHQAGAKENHDRADMGEKLGQPVRAAPARDELDHFGENFRRHPCGGEPDGRLSGKLGVGKDARRQERHDPGRIVLDRPIDGDRQRKADGRRQTTQR